MATDHSNNLYNSSQNVMFHHSPSGTSLKFKAFDLAYSEAIVNNWETTELTWRVNQRHRWQSVRRNISLGWSMPAFDLAEAKSNLAKCSKMIQFMYPMVDDDGNVAGQNPLWYLGVMNWAHNSNAERAGDTSDTLLMGFPTNFDWNIINSDGFLYDPDGGQDPYPKNIKVSLTWMCILDETTAYGWSDKTGQWVGPAHFPWSAS
jgi:hypothetical protein